MKNWHGRAKSWLRQKVLGDFFVLIWPTLGVVSCLMPIFSNDRGWSFLVFPIYWFLCCIPAVFRARQMLARARKKGPLEFQLLKASYELVASSIKVVLGFSALIIFVKYLFVLLAKAKSLPLEGVLGALNFINEDSIAMYFVLVFIAFLTIVATSLDAGVKWDARAAAKKGLVDGRSAKDEDSGKQGDPAKVALEEVSAEKEINA